MNTAVRIVRATVLAAGLVEYAAAPAFAAVVYTVDEPQTVAENVVSCGCLATPGSLDLSGVSISVANMAACPPRGLTIVDAGSVTGTPSISLDVPCTSVVSGGRVRVGVPGCMLIFR